MMLKRLLLTSILCLLLSACAETRNSDVPGFPPTDEIDTSANAPKGFDLAHEARPLLELCIELNSDAGKQEADPAVLAHWTQLLDMKADRDKSKGTGPFNNAWKLWKSNDQPNVRAIVIRGTTADARSILADILATSVAADAVVGVGDDQALRLRLSNAPAAETHLGFTYSLAVLLFHKDTGILAALRNEELVPPGSVVYITGHSQGAAVATLAHAFLHYAINDQQDTYGLRDKGFALKSYFFAQPKPGNWQFAMDFARYAGSRGASYVINNSIDWVPQVPLGVEFLSEPVSDLAPEEKPGDPTAPSFLGGFSSVIKFQRWLFAKTNSDTLDRVMAKHRDELDSGYFQPRSDLPGKAASSINYVACGNQVPVFGHHSGDPELHDGWLTQHHGPTYRRLMDEQLQP